MKWKYWSKENLITTLIGSMITCSIWIPIFFILANVLPFSSLGKFLIMLVLFFIGTIPTVLEVKYQIWKLLYGEENE